MREPSWRWMVRVNSSDLFGLKFESKVSPDPVAIWFTPGYHGCGRFWTGGGKGATQGPVVGQSTPTRKTFAGVVPPQVVLFPTMDGAPGPPHVSGCSNPGVRSGTKRGLTPLIRP